MSNLNDNSDDPDCCGACGKCSDSLKACTACESVKYCGAPCQKAHRPHHEKECTELHDAALFKRPPAREDCPICMLPLPFERSHQRYQACCGKILCCGCLLTMADQVDAEPLLCPFCRAVENRSPTGAAELERIKRRVDAKDAHAISLLGYFYEVGRYELPQDYAKAMELWLQAGELGHAAAYSYVAKCYLVGLGKDTDIKKAEHYLELAAMRGDLPSRHMLGNLENSNGNIMKAVNHWMMAAEAGFDESLKMIRECFMLGSVSKQDFAKALRAHKESKDEMESEDRAAFSAALNS